VNSNKNRNFRLRLGQSLDGNYGGYFRQVWSGYFNADVGAFADSF